MAASTMRLEPATSVLMWLMSGANDQRVASSWNAGGLTGDQVIIEAVLHGQTSRYAELVSRYQAAAWRLAYGFLGNMEDAKDVSQNGFVKAYRHLGRFRGDAKFSTWLYRIIVNECKDFFKRKARQPKTLSLSPDPEDDEASVFEVADPDGDPRDVVANRELAIRLGKAIRALPGKQQTAFVLRHLNGLSLEEASQIMGCRVGTVKAHCFRACEQLRVHLSPYVKEGSP